MRQDLHFVADSDESRFSSLSSSATSGIAVVAEPYSSLETPTLHSDGMDFVKWLRAASPEVKVAVPEPTPPRVLLRDANIWIPLVFLAKDVALPIFLGWVSAYLYDRTKGALSGEATTARIRVVYRDSSTGKYLRYEFEGDHEQLKTAIKKFDPNKLLSERAKPARK